MDPFEPIAVDPIPASPNADPTSLPTDEDALRLKPQAPYYDAADVGLAAANAAAFIALSGIGGEMEKGVTGAVETYGEPLVGSPELIDEAVSRAADSSGPQTELSDGCSGCAAAILVLLTLSAGSALAFAL